MKKVVLGTLLVITLITSGCSSLAPKVKTGQHAYSMEKEVKVTAKLNYLMYTPKGYPDAQEKWPLMLFLHGGGEKGDNIELVKRNGPPMLAEKKDFPFIIVSPQCPANESWNSHKQILAYAEQNPTIYLPSHDPGSKKRLENRTHINGRSS